MMSPRLLGICTAVVIALAAPFARADEAEDRTALRAIKDLYERAVNEDNLELLAPHVDESFTGVMLTSKPVKGLAGMKDYWKDMKDLMGSAGRYSVSVSVEPANFFGDLAVARGETKDLVKLPGKEYRFEGQWTAVCQKKDGAWKILRIHSSMDPLGNPFVKDMGQVKVLARRSGYAGGGLAAGLVLGLLLGRRRARRTATA